MSGSLPYHDLREWKVDEFLEELTYWADDLGTVYAFPQIDGNRRILSMKITGNPYPIGDRFQGYVVSDIINDHI